MPTNRKYRSRARQTGNRATPALVSLLAEPGNIETTVRLAARVGVPPLDKLDDENDQDVAEGVGVLRRLWLLHCDAALEYCLKRHGPGRRPALWWDGKNRPYVRPRDWCLDGDYQRFESERAAADLKFLEEHKFLRREERVQLAEMQKGEKLWT